MLEHGLDARSVIPYSDQEIRELYYRARFGSDPTKGIEHEVTERTARSNYSIIEVVLLTVGLYGIAGAALSPFIGIEATLWVSAIVFAVTGSLVVARLRKGPIGPLTYHVRTKVRRDIKMKLEEIDPYSLEVLVQVVRYVAWGPLDQAEKLVKSIEADVAKVDASLQELPPLVADLEREIEHARDESVRLLLESKRTSAQSTIERLQNLRGALQKQAQDAEEAVLPVKDLCERINYINRLSTSLSRIQAAHGIVEETEQRIEDHRLELQLLRAVSTAATARLEEIQRIVNAQEQAQAEVLAI